MTRYKVRVHIFNTDTGEHEEKVFLMKAFTAKELLDGITVFSLPDPLQEQFFEDEDE